jgi:hypothetical protein
VQHAKAQEYYLQAKWQSQQKFFLRGTHDLLFDGLTISLGFSTFTACRQLISI